MGVQHLSPSPPNESGTLVRHPQTARSRTGFEWMLGSQGHALDTEKRMGQRNAGREWLLSALSSSVHHTNQTRPVDLGGTLELARTGVTQSGQFLGVECVAQIVESPAAGTAEHLEKLVGFNLSFEVAGEITPVGDHN